MDRVKPVGIARRVLVTVAVAAGLAAFVPTIASAQVTLGAPAPKNAPATQQAAAGFVSKVFKDATGEHKYGVYVPSNYSPDVRWPVILYLHGAGERGNDGTLQTTVGLGPFVKARRDDFPYLVVFPQCEDLQGSILQAWSPASPDGRRALAILAQVERDYSIDSHRRILTGWSMGGYGTWSQGAADPTHWAALVPVSGGGDPAWGAKLAQVPIWAWAGADDQVVAPRETQRMVDAVRAAGGHPLLTIVPNVGHDVWKNAYNDSQLYVWLMNPKEPPGGGSTTGTAAPSTGFSAQAGARSPAPANLEGPFVPALSIPNAISVRLGNDALRAIAYSAPKMIAADALTGSINDIYSSTESSGYSFSVQFSRISYAGTLDRAYLKAYAPDHLNVQLAIRATMTIGATYVSGAGRSAYAGPISVVIGSRYPVWLGIDVTPYIDGDRLRLRYNSGRFEIPPDDWYVTPPYGVSGSLPSDRISSGLVEGIYGQKGRIEQEVQQIIPFLLSKVEERLDLSEVSQVANAFWPLPVYRPRLQVWPQAVSTDERGVSLVMGVTAAAIDPRKAPSKPQVEASAGIELSSVGSGTDLGVSVAPDVLKPLTKMLIEDDVARINVLDIPEKSFAAFADRKTLSQIFPDLASAPPDTQVWAELRLVSPISVKDGGPAQSIQDSRTAVAKKESSEGVSVTAMKANPSEPIKSPKKDANKATAKSTASHEAAPAHASGPRAFEFVVPRAVISIATKDSPSATKWTPYAELDVDLIQRATATLLRRGFSERALRIDWSGEPEVKASAHFAPGVSPKNSEIQTDKLKDLFVTSWRAWTHNGPASQVPVADVNFQYAKLRLDGVEWSPPALSVRFDDPGIKITNSSSSDLVYEMKDIYSPWSSEITLAPGKSQEFKISVPLLYRRVLSGGGFAQNYTLPVGLQYDYRTPPTGGQPNLYRVREPGAEH